MDAKSRANFINSVASGENISCSKCGAKNKSGAKFCVACGEELNVSQEAQKNAPAFAPVNKAATRIGKYVEPSNVFAQGLPAWSIEPPQVMVRRH